MEIWEGGGEAEAEAEVVVGARDVSSSTGQVGRKWRASYSWLSAWKLGVKTG